MGHGEFIKKIRQEKNLTQNNGREYIPESIVKEGTIVKLEILIKP